MTKTYDVSLREAVKLLGKKPATIRSYVRSGRLSKQYVEGFNGQEMRLNREELLELKKSLKETTDVVAERSPRKSIKQGGEEGHAATLSDTVTDGTVTRAIELLERELEELRKEKETLRVEAKEITEKNFQMAGQLGYYQNQVETLKDQVKQLSAPTESRAGSKLARKANFWERLGFSRK